MLWAMIGVMATLVCSSPGQDVEGELEKFVSEARSRYGGFGERAATFLVAGMPEEDRTTLTGDFLLENLALALKAREEFPWAGEVPEEMFFNYVLPYACLDETREPWRGPFLERVRPLVSNCETASEAAQVLNREFFDGIGVHYDTGRKRPNQSPSESISLRMASCTGLSIILVDACRAAGIPARVVGTPLWTNKRGNHTWVEIWAEGKWHFMGAGEHDPKGLNRAWFVNDAAKADASDWKHAIWATSWKPTGIHFPLVWNLDDKDVHGINVTGRYANPEGASGREATIHFRVFDEPGGERLALPIEVVDESGNLVGSVVTKAGTADLNDMPSVKVPAHGGYVARVRNGGALARVAIRLDEGAESRTVDLAWNELVDRERSDEGFPGVPAGDWLALGPGERGSSLPTGPLTREEADAVSNLLWKMKSAKVLEERETELEKQSLSAAGKKMKWLERKFGRVAEGERSLWISMHGGGGAPASVNDRQWRNQIRLYEPQEGIVVAPRAPTDNWNLWHEGHIDDLFDRLIENFVICRGVDPNRVYLMGYSAGGDGVYQLAPRMADRFAAAAMMAGHPNGASPQGLRNLPFMIFVGGKDTAYKRNTVAAEWGRKLDTLRKDDPGGYEHKVTIFPHHGHWMQGDDREALPWMAGRSRNPWPKKIVWRQSNRAHERFYWLQMERAEAKGGQVIRAEVSGQKVVIELEGELTGLTLRLNDALLNLDDALEVVVDGKTVFEGMVERKVGAISRSLDERLDPKSVATSLLEVSW